MSAIGFRTSLEKKKDATGDRVVITLDGKVSCLHRQELTTVLAILKYRSMGHVCIEMSDDFGSQQIISLLMTNDGYDSCSRQTDPTAPLLILRTDPMLKSK